MEGSQGSSKEIYYALTGDMVGSRTIEDRVSVQATFLEALERLNDDVGEELLAAPLRLTAGDEVQGLLRNPVAVVDISVGIADALHPVVVRWGLGVGPVVTKLSADVTTMDGPCFHLARNAVGRASGRKGWLVAEGFGEEDDAAITALFTLMGVLRSMWTGVQAKYVASARDRLQKEVAKLYGVDETAVSHSLRSARFREVQEGEEAARRFLAAWPARRGAEPREDD